MTSAPRIIAEIGTSHGGDIVHATELIAAAAEAGADAVKTQIVIADEILHPRTGHLPLPGGATDLYTRFRTLERPESFYADVRDACLDRGVTFLASVFGIESARMLSTLGVTEVKIASPEANHVPLLREVAGYALPVVVSTGVTTLSDIEGALLLLDSVPAVTLLHCVTAYPAPEEDYNVRVIGTLRDAFGVDVGLSDHSLDPEFVPALATVAGATVIEKHITLSNASDGVDDRVALTPDRFMKMTRRVRTVAHQCAIGNRGTTERALEVEFGAARVAAALGNGVKRLAPSERANYGLTNRSIHALEDLEPGEVVTKKNSAILRTEKRLSPGLHPCHWDTVLGCTVKAAVGAGDGITWRHLLSRP